MQERVKTSFIPKASLQVERERPKTGDSLAIVNTIAGIILIIVIIAAVGVFLFQSYTLSSIASKQASLDKSRAAFEPATIKELARLDTRIETGKTLLADHTALSHLFDDLEARTLSSVRFTNFAFTSTGSGDIELTMEGTAASFNAVAVQSEQFSESSIITDPIFSNVNISTTGSVIFDFAAVVSGSALRYDATIAPPAPAASSTPSL